MSRERYPGRGDDRGIDVLASYELDSEVVVPVAVGVVVLVVVVVCGEVLVPRAGGYRYPSVSLAKTHPAESG